MEDAGTVDLRGQEDLPFILQVLGPTAPPGADTRAQEMRDRLAAWVTTETHRRDFDHDGAYDDPQAPAIMDAFWTRLAHEMFDAGSGNAIDNLGLTLDDTGRREHIGSAFDDAFYSHVNKDLRRVLALAQSDPWSRIYCGSGVLADCRNDLWAAMSEAAGDLETEFASPNVADWKRQIVDEDVRQSAVGITTVPAIHWINRPTFQQVVQIPTVDHFKCYQARAKTPFASQAVTLVDQFGLTTTSVLRPDSICNPVDKDGAGIANSTTHLACYRIRDVPRTAPSRLPASDEFGSRTLGVQRARTLCVPSAQDGVASTLSIDHFKCYKAGKAAPRFTKRIATLADVFETKVTTVVKPQVFCDAVDKNGEGVRDANARLVCYKIRNAAGQTKFVPRDASVANQFGTETVTALKTGMLCVPAAQQ